MNVSDKVVDVNIKLTQAASDLDQAVDKRIEIERMLEVAKQEEADAQKVVQELRDEQNRIFDGLSKGEYAPGAKPIVKPAPTPEPVANPAPVAAKEPPNLSDVGGAVAADFKLGGA